LPVFAQIGTLHWFVILENNKNAIQIGLTATPRQIRMPEAQDEETRRQLEEDRRLLADNLRYFGEPAYEYTYQQGVADGYLAPAEIETYDLFHDRQEQPERVRGVYRSELAAQNLLPELLRESAHMEAYDEFDVLAAFAYRVPPLTRTQRAEKFGDTGPAWLIQLPQPTAKVIRKIVKQFETAGTGALETGQLWKTIDEPNAIETLRQGGQPAALLREAFSGRI
jgi:type I site-specific restriction endonuclease